MVALREHADKVPRPISPSRSSAMVMVRPALRLCFSATGTFVLFGCFELF